MTSDHSGFVYEVGEWVLVPREPTPEMLKSAQDGPMLSRYEDADNIREVWSAMLAAAPTPAEPSSPSLHAAVHAFLAKFDECKPHVDDAFLHRQLRCGPYTGPNYGGELEAMRAAHIAEASDLTFSTAEPSEEEVERVARAICQADEQNGGAPWDWYGTDKARSGYFDSARAAIAALRAPAGRVEKEVGSDV